MADRSVNVKLRADISDYIAKMSGASAATRDAEKSARDLRKALDEEEAAAGRLRVAQQRLTEIQADGKAKASQLAAAEEEVSRAQRQHETATDRVTQANKRFVESQRKAADESDRSSKRTDDSMGRLAARTNAQFDALKFTGLSVGLPAAAAVGAAGVTAAVALAGAGFAALGVYAASSSEKVQTAAKGMANNVLDDVNGMGQAIEGDIIGALQDAGKAWDRLSPQVQAAVADSGPAIRELGGSVTDLAENAMPGLLTAVQSSEPVFKGIRSFAGQAGDGLSQFFANASQGSAAAGAGIAQFGGTVQLVEGRLGTLFANLAQGSSGPLNSLHVIVDEATGALVRMTAQGSGVLGFLQGFSTAGSGLITVLSGAVSLLSSLPPGLTQFGGSLTATSMLLSKFGIDATAGFDGFGGKVKALAGDLANARNPMNSLKDAGTGLVSGALNPAGIATIGLSVLLAELGRRQEEAAAKAQAHASNVQNLTAALREDGGVIGASVQQTTAKALADKNAAANARAFGSDIGELTAAATGHAGAMESVIGKSDALIDSWQKQGKLSQQEADWNKINIKGLADKGGAAADVANMYGSLTAAEQAQLRAMENGVGAAGEQYKSLKETQEAARNLKAALSGVSTEQLKMNEASTTGQAAAANLSSAFNDLAKAGGDVQSKGAAMVQVFDSLHGSQLRAEDAQQAWNDQMRTAGDLLKGLNLPVHDKNFLSTAGAINTASEAGSKLQNFVQEAAVHMSAFAQSMHDQGKSAGEITAALQPMEGQLRSQLKAWGLNDKQVQDVLAHYGAIPGQIETVLKVTGGEASKVQVQTVLEELLKVPPEKGVKVSTLTDDAKKNLEDLGYKVVALPDGTFQVFANTAPGQQAAGELLNTINHYQGTVEVHADTGQADASVRVWQQRTDGTYGMTTTDSRVDPATGKVQTWLRQANGTWAWTNTDSRVDSATGKVQLWVQQTNGKWAWVNADARTGAAEGALNYAARTRTAIIQGVFIAPSTSGLGAAANRLANGGLLTPQPVSFYAGGGLRPLPGNRATMVSPNTWRVVGDNMTVPELFAPLNGSRRTKDLIVQAARHEKILGFSGGGMASAAEELLARINGGGSFYEDFSYRGSTGNMDVFNDALSKMYYGQGGKFDQGSVKSWLSSYVGQSPVSQAINSGASRGGGGYAGSRMGMSYRFEFGRGSGQLEQALIAWLKDTIRKRGGDVQKALT